MVKRNVWKHINKKNIPQERKPIRSKWVFMKKKNGVYHAKLVALGYSQVPGVNFTENYAPVINNITMRTILVIMSLLGWKGEIVDMETAFLYRKLEEEIYMSIPNGLTEHTKRGLNKKCLVLNKSNYGLVQAAHAQ